jgi:hypothetical protein
MEFVEASAFTRCLPDYLDDENYRPLQTYLIRNPEAGDVMPGTGGFRKVRWVDQRRKKGKRGGIRVIYYYFPEDTQIWFVTLYDKDQADDLTTDQKKRLREAISAEKAARATVRKSTATPLSKRKEENDVY